MTPFLSDPDFTLYVGDVRDVLRELPAASVDCVVTSPPYWGLRDYGSEGQIGLEATPQEYVATMVEVFREVRRMLAPHGTVWLNLGDSYAGSVLTRPFKLNKGRDSQASQVPPPSRDIPPGTKPKDLCGIPWRTAFALQDDGWYLRSDIIWAKPNVMPESVTDRPTKAHEYVFLLAKQPRYFFDQEAVREPHSPDGRKKTVHDHATDNSHANYDNVGKGNERWPNGGRNIRSVWTITTRSYQEAHFAVFPEELPRRAILAGCPEWVCRTCGKPRERLTGRECDECGATIPTQGKECGSCGYRNTGWADNRVVNESRRADDVHQAGRRVPWSKSGGFENNTAATGWSDCGHNDYRPGRVLDPFIGSGTTAYVARNHGRHTVGVELNPEYAALIGKRTQQQSLLS